MLVYYLAVKTPSKAEVGAQVFKLGDCNSIYRVVVLRAEERRYLIQLGNDRKTKKCMITEDLEFHPKFIGNRKSGLETRSRRVNTAIPVPYDPAVLEESSPNAEWSKVDYGVHAVDARIQDQRPNRRIHLGEKLQFYEGFRRLLLAWVSC
jgi:hypothetical protein